MSNFIKLVGRLVTPKIVISFIVFAILLLLLPWQFIPDYFKLGSIIGKKDTVFRLLTTIIGSSSVMLTLLLVGYNFYVKTTRRFTLEFVTDNSSLKLIVSLFFGMVLFLGLGFFLLDTSAWVNNVTFLYVAYVFTIFYLLAMFPLALLAINDSNSLKRVFKLLDRVTDDNIKNLYEAQFDHQHTIDGIEKHPILIIRDLCNAAVADKDWVLPQAVLARLYEKVIIPLNQHSLPPEINRAFFVWTLIGNGLKREVVKNNDYATGNTLLYLTLNIHEHLATNKIIQITPTEIDGFLQDYLRLIIEHNAFNTIQPFVSRDLTRIILCYFEELQYTDEEIPTMESRMSKKEERLNSSSTELTPIIIFWHYLTSNLLDLLFDTMEYAMDMRRKSIYSSLYFNIHHTMEMIFRESKLTPSQKQNAIKRLLNKSRILSDYAIAHQIYENIEPISEIQIEAWFKKDPILGWEGLYSLGKMMQRLISKNADVTRYLDQLFMVGRAVSYIELDNALFNEIIDYILKLALELFKKENNSPQFRQTFLYELNWFYRDYLSIGALSPVREKYEIEIVDLLHRYDDQIPKHWL